jgi:hypothetical protein
MKCKENEEVSEKASKAIHPVKKWAIPHLSGEINFLFPGLCLDCHMHYSILTFKPSVEAFTLYLSYSYAPIKNKVDAGNTNYCYSVSYSISI